MIDLLLPTWLALSDLFADSMCGICEYKNMNKLINRYLKWKELKVEYYTKNQTEVITISKGSIQ